MTKAEKNYRRDNLREEIDLKFMLAEQKENNPRAKMSMAKTLDWFYKFVQDAIDRGNMKVASIAKNIIAEYGIDLEQIRQIAVS